MSSVAAIEKSTSPPVQLPLRIAHVNAESEFYGGESQLFLLV